MTAVIAEWPAELLPYGWHRYVILFRRDDGVNISDNRILEVRTPAELLLMING